MSDVVKMVRDAAAYPDSHNANVSADDVATFEAMGWMIEGAERLVKPVSVEVVAVPMAVDVNANGYLSKAEIIAALTAKEIAHDPDAKRVDLLALLKSAE